MIQTNLQAARYLSSQDASTAPMKRLMPFCLEDIWVDLYCFVFDQKCAMCQTDPGSLATTHGFHLITSSNICLISDGSCHCVDLLILLGKDELPFLNQETQ